MSSTCFICKSPDLKRKVDDAIANGHSDRETSALVYSSLGIEITPRQVQNHRTKHYGNAPIQTYPEHSISDPKLSSLELQLRIVNIKARQIERLDKATASGINTRIERLLTEATTQLSQLLSTLDYYNEE